MDVIKKLVAMIITATCPDCNGSGTKGDDDCNMCGGTGNI